MSETMYLVYDPLDGDHQECKTLKEAQEKAKELIESYIECCDGWPQEMESDGVKIYLLLEQSEKYDVKKREDYDPDDWINIGADPEWSEMCSYQMEPVSKNRTTDVKTVKRGEG